LQVTVYEKITVFFAPESIPQVLLLAFPARSGKKRGANLPAKA
jgi:hypothetical protein